MSLSQHVRRRQFIDPALQRGLIVVIVLLQALLLTAILYGLYDKLAALLDAQLYRVHQTGDPLLVILLEQTAPAVGLLLACNISLLLAAEWFWARRLQRLSARLLELARASEALDFSPVPSSAATHRVLAQALAWREQEGARLSRFRTLLHQLDQAPAHERPNIVVQLQKQLGQDMQR
jgi:hypothetical protein